MTRTIAASVASRFQSRFLRGYARWKLALDPLYPAVAERLRGNELPILDIGCGVGLMEFYLRDSGCSQPMLGIDHDESKTREATRAAGRDREITFRTGQAQTDVAGGSTVLLLDVLHYLSDDEQERLMEAVASAVPAGGMAIVRDAIADGSWRYRLTYAAEVFARASRWLKAARLNFPRRDLILAPFRAHGFAIEVVPLWGRTPFNNYLFVFRREGSGMTKR